MVLCILALPIFAVLGIFSLKYRKLTLEALDCLFKTATLRKCRSSLDDRTKAAMAGKALKFSPKAAGLVYRNYKIISWLLLIIFLWSAYEGSLGAYNYYKYGNCNGPSDTGLCLLDPTGSNSKISAIDIDTQTNIVYPFVEKDDPIIGSESAKLTIIEFGCYACPYTKKAEPIIKEVLEHYQGKVNLQFKTFYIPSHHMSYKSALAADCANEQGKYKEFHNLVFQWQDNISDDTINRIADNTGLDTKKFNDCIAKERYKSEVDADTLMGVHAGVSGTPTFFINKQKIVGPKPFRTFKSIIDEELKK